MEVTMMVFTCGAIFHNSITTTTITTGAVRQAHFTFIKGVLQVLCGFGHNFTISRFLGHVFTCFTCLVTIGRVGVTQMRALINLCGVLGIATTRHTTRFKESTRRRKRLVICVTCTCMVSLRGIKGPGVGCLCRGLNVILKQRTMYTLTTFQ